MSEKHKNVYTNAVTGATENPVMLEPDLIDEAFATETNEVLKNAAELARVLIGAHQSAIAIIVEGDWSSVRKYFSLSDKYAEWKDYKTPAVGFGIHKWILEHNQMVRLTQSELETHPEWKNFGKEADRHPPMRGWMATPLVDSNGKNWGMFQLSDKYDGEFDAEDEVHFQRLTALVSQTLEALWKIRNLRKAAEDKDD